MSDNQQVKMPASPLAKKGSRRGLPRNSAATALAGSAGGNPRWVRAVLGIPLELKLLGANLIIVAVAVFVLLGPAPSQPGYLTGASIVVTGLMLGGLVNFVLVRLALRPIGALERVAKRVSEGRLGDRVPASLIADRELTRLSTTLNEMLDTLATSRERMRKLGAQVVYGEERERAQVARELHDTVGQTLAAASLQIAAIVSDSADQAMSSRLTAVRELLHTALEEIRSVSRSLHPRVAVDLGLPTALEALGDATQERSLVAVRVDIDTTGVVIPPALSATLYRVAQEALRNVERHADAARVTVSLRAKPGYVQLEITDDGCGFERPLGNRREGAGLAAIRERLSLAGGDLHIDMARDRGTRITAWVGTDTEAA